MGIFVGVENMNYLKTLVLIVMVAGSNVSASTGLEELMGNMHLSSGGWVARAKAILPQVASSDDLRVEIQSMIATLHSNPSEALAAMVTWFGVFSDAEQGSEGDHFRKAVLSIFHPTT